MEMQKSVVARGTLLLWVFVLSGFAGLIYQSIWTQYLGLFLGHSSYAQSLVLILFMGGMALGAWWASRRTETLARPLLTYAAIEVAIGFLGLTFDPIYAMATNFAYDQLFPTLGATGAVATVRWTISILLVFPACILLGATFPLMSAGFLRLAPESGGRVLAGLYFSNSIGAAAGALAATYLLLPLVGLPGTVMTAGLLNILVAVLVYPASKKICPAVRVDTARTEHTSASGFVLLVAAFTGATSFVYEIVWIRMLSLAVGTTLHAFELMLAAFIAGIALGGLWLRNRADKWASPLSSAGWVQILMGLAALASLLVYANSFEWVGWLMRVIVRSAEGYVTYNFATAVIAVLVMFPTAFFAGMTLPLLTLALLRAGDGERVIGRIYAANTLGAIIGVLVAVHVLMPALGVKLALWLAAAIDLGLGIALLTRARGNGTKVPALGFAATVCCLCLAGALMVRFDPLVLASSVYRTGATALGSDAEMLYYEDGKTASVSVYESGSPASRRYSIATNGKVDAGLATSPSSNPGSDEFTMVLLPALPLALMEHPSEVGIIGFGSGMTTHTLLGSNRIKQVDTVEIEPAMVQGARIFEPLVGRAFNDPRSRIIIDDAKAYFSSSRKKYDLIISEPSNPWMGGTASLFTEQFYDFVPRHLADDGLFVQWLQLYEINPELVASVLKAMLPRFRDVNAYLANGGDLILIASPHGKIPAAAAIPDADVALYQELHRIGVESPRDFMDGFVMDRDALSAYAQLHDAKPNSDYFPFLQLNAPQARFMGSQVTVMDDILAAPWPIGPLLGGYSLRSVHDPLPTTRREISIDRKLRAARELRAAMISGEPIQGTFTKQQDAIQMEALRGLGQRCKLDAAPAQSAQMIFSIAMETVAFLTPEDSQGLWSEPRWISCPPSHPLVVGALDFVSAAANGDHHRVIEAGARLLDGEDSSLLLQSADSSYYIRGAMQFSALALNDSKLAKSLMDKYDGKLRNEVKSQTVLRFLNQLSLNRAEENYE
ncbi:MAG: fused MFS/spermidine synthase [Luteimonas sp.]